MKITTTEEPVDKGCIKVAFKIETIYFSLQKAKELRDGLNNVISKIERRELKKAGGNIK